MVNKEIWKDIKGYERLYQISNFGRVKSFVKVKPGESKLLRPSISKKGYLSVTLTKSKVRKGFLIHRLVAQEFISNKKNMPIVCHIDDNPKNNNFKNLFWGTNQDNMNDMVSKRRHRSHGQTHCKRGHEFNPKTVHIDKSSNRRICMPCRKLYTDKIKDELKEYGRQYYLKNKEKFSERAAINYAKRKQEALSV